VGTVALVGEGAWSTAFSYRLGDEDLVIRFGSLREDFDRDRIAASFTAPHLPIPAVLEIDEAFGGWFAISQRLRGGFLDDLDGAAMRAMLPSLFAMLDAVRAVDLSATTGYGNWDASGNGPFATWGEALLAVADHAGSRVAGWRDKLARSAISSEAFARAHTALREAIPLLPPERHVIHSDLLNFNVLVERGWISGVLDWGCSLYGDHLYDLAWFIFWQPWYPAWQEIDFAAEARRHFDAIGLPAPNVAERLRAYQLHIGLDSLVYKSSIEQWDELDVVARRLIALSV
jgi:hygromycin-B 4-O-kinase